MNLNCTHCNQPTIAQKWLVLSTLLPFVFLFLQIKCGRCKTEQQYELELNVFLDLLLSMVAPILVVLIFLYVIFFCRRYKLVDVFVLYRTLLIS